MRKTPKRLFVLPGALLATVAFSLTLVSCKKDIDPEVLADFKVAVPNDPRFSELWGLKKIEAPGAWGLVTDCSAIKTAIIDTGMDYHHNDLAGNLYIDPSTGKPGKDITNSDSDPADDNYHGTHVSGTIGGEGNDSIGIVGVCWKASLFAAKVLDSSGSGTNADVATGMTYAYGLGAKVMNMSLGGTASSAAVETAVLGARSAGTIIVAAAGNSANNNDTLAFYPAGYNTDNMISVAAIGKDEKLASFSNYGATTVHIAAPGVEILSSFPTTVTSAMTSAGKTSTYETLQGTSMAAPHVTGAVTLLWALHPTYSYTEIRELLFSKAKVNKDLYGYVMSGRRLNLGPSI